jgi:hypothetical protein
LPSPLTHGPEGLPVLHGSRVAPAYNFGSYHLIFSLGLLKFGPMYEAIITNFYVVLRSAKKSVPGLLNEMTIRVLWQRTKRLGGRTHLASIMDYDWNRTFELARHPKSIVPQPKASYGYSPTTIA